MEPQLQELLDKKACEEVIHRYGRTQDWLDDEGHSTVFWPDADVDFGFFKGSGEDFVTTVMAHEHTVPRRWHLCTSVMVQLDGDTAKAECYGIAVGASEANGGGLQDTMFGGRYLDELEKRNGEWRISKRTYILDWSHQFPDALEQATGADFDLHVLSITDGGHPMYRRL